MGDFNVACGASDISMGYDRAVLIPLVPRIYSGFKDGRFAIRGANLVSNSGAGYFFEPWTLPIFGTLNTYGRLEDIERDANTECIEAYFGMDIDVFAEAIAYGGFRNEDIPEQMKDVPFAGMFVHRDIYELMTSQAYDEWGKPAYSVWDSAQTTTHICGLLGFVLEREDDNRKRYNQLLVNPRYPTVEIWSDGRWIQLEIAGEAIEHVYRVSKLVETIEEKTGIPFPDELKKSLKEFSEDAALFDEKLAWYKEAQAKVDAAIDESARKFYETMLELGTAHFRPLSLRDHLDDEGTELFRKMYMPRIDELRTLFHKLETFRYSLNAINRILMPTCNGYQYGNHYASRMVHEKALEILNAKIAEAEKYRDDD